MLSIILLLWFTTISFTISNEEDEGVQYANKCEGKFWVFWSILLSPCFLFFFFLACKILAIELENRLQETGKTSDVLEIGYSVDDVKPKKKKEYRKSLVWCIRSEVLSEIDVDCFLWSDLHFDCRELRLVESLDGICEKILEYNIHKERKDSTRFAKGMSQTFQTLHGLV